MQRYWVLKTKEGRGGRDYWDHFLSEGVIAIGWHEISVRPHIVDQKQLESAIKKRYPHEDEKYGARTIKKFIEIGVGDKVLICQGYAPNQSKDVYIYGLAKVTGSFYDDASADWWTFKHRADIRTVGRRVPKSLLQGTLGKSSMLLTLHEVHGEQFGQLELRL